MNEKQREHSDTEGSDLSTKYTLAIETSCDETCAAVVDSDLKVYSNIVSSQIDIHKLYGGVVPEVASRNHLAAIGNVVEEALRVANVDIRQIAQIAATTQPGLVGAVMVGRVFAESLALASNKPFVEVNHLMGHIASVFLSNPTLKPPLVCLVVSGGHTSLYRVNYFSKCEASGKVKAEGTPSVQLISHTIDDACGEAFDKVAKVLGLGYPGGPIISKIAEQSGCDYNIPLMEKSNYKKDLNFSYSGLKSAVINYINRRRQKNEEINIADACHAFQREAIAQLVVKCNMARGDMPLAICGGVAANQFLRECLPDAFFPELKYCGDNAAMIAAAAILFKDVKL